MTPRFQLDTFEQLPAGTEDAILRIAGRWLLGAEEETPTPSMLVDDGTRTYRLTAESSDHDGQTLPGPDGVQRVWRGTFRAPREVVEAERVAFALESGPGGLVDLPRPGGVLAQTVDAHVMPSVTPPIEEPARPYVPFAPSRLTSDAETEAPAPPLPPTSPQPPPPPPEPPPTAIESDPRRRIPSLADIQEALAAAERQTGEVIALRQSLAIAEQERERTRRISDDAVARATKAERELDAANSRLTVQERELRLAVTAAEQGDRLSETLREERSARRQAESELERQLREHAEATSERHSELTAELHTLRQRYEQELAERREAEARASAAETELASVRVAATEEAARAERAESELTGLTTVQRRLDDAQRRISDLEPTVERSSALESELADERAEVQLLRERLADVQTARAAEVQALRAALADAERTAGEAEAQRRRESEELELRLAETQERATRDAAAAELARRELDELTASSERRRRDAEAEASTLRAWLAAADTRAGEESGHLRTELEAARRSIQDLRTQLDAAHAAYIVPAAPLAQPEVDRLRQSAEELRAQLAGADIRLAEQAQQFQADLHLARDEANRQASGLQQRLADAEQRAAAAPVEAAEKAAREAEELREQLVDATSALQSAQQERDAIAAQLSETEARLTAEDSDRESHGEILTALQARLEEAEAENRDAERDLEQVRAVLAEQAAQPTEDLDALRAAAEAGAHATTELEGLRSMYAAVNDAHERVAKRERELKDELSGLEDIRLERDTALAQLDRAREELEAAQQTPPPVADEDFGAELATLRGELDAARAQLEASERARASAAPASSSQPPTLKVIDGSGEQTGSESETTALVEASAPTADATPAAPTTEEAQQALESIRRERRTLGIVIAIALVVTALIVAGALTDVLGL